MNGLNKALFSADENSLTEMANKGIYKRACKDIEGADITSMEDSGGVTVSIGGETVTMAVPLTDCKCSCVSRTVCRHIVGAILWLKKWLTEEDIADVMTEENSDVPQSDTKNNTENDTKNDTENDTAEPTQKPLSDKDRERIKSCAEGCLDLMGDIIRHGIVRLSDTFPDSAEVAAVQCHALKMAEGERMMRDIGTRLTACLGRRASFSIDDFTAKLCRTASYMNELTEPDFSADFLGTFRQTYETVSGDLTILPIGQRSVAGGDHEGEVYYFLNMTADDHPYLSFSDLRPVFYDDTKRRRSTVYPWGLTLPLTKLMRKKIVLANAKLSGGRLSSSQETQVVMTTAAELNCRAMQEKIYSNFRQAAVELYEKQPKTDLDRLMLIHPQRCISSNFDKVSQMYTLVMEDGGGARAYIRMKYRKEAKSIIELVETIANRMIAEPEKRFTILALGSLKNGELTLYPVEIYDFIDTPYYDDEYEIPDEYAVSADEGYYSRILYELLTEMRERLGLMVQCGIQAYADSFVKLENACFNYGMKGLSRLCGDLGRMASAYRHDMNSDTKAILLKMAELEKYINTAINKLEIILATKGE